LTISSTSGGCTEITIQIAKAFVAEVTAICSTKNLEMVRSFGADHVIDNKEEDFTKNSMNYDLILAVNGYHPISDYLLALELEGTYVVLGGSMLQLFQAASYKRNNSDPRRLKTFVVSLTQNQKDLIFIKELIVSGKIIPVIDVCYPLCKISDVFWYLEKAHPKGKVVMVWMNITKRKKRIINNKPLHRQTMVCFN
jgi:D-arabinose 1-dehydrogenase-like Zn-dependent alcohol dehydrogenase